jgi:hypothetical protein
MRVPDFAFGFRQMGVDLAGEQFAYLAMIGRVVFVVTPDVRMHRIFPSL